MENKSSLPSYKEIINQTNLEEDNQNKTELMETTEILFDTKTNKHSNENEESSLNISKESTYENTQVIDIIGTSQEKLFESSNNYESLSTNIDSDILFDNTSFNKEETFSNIIKTYKVSNSENYTEILIPKTEDIFSEKASSSLFFGSLSD